MELWLHTLTHNTHPLTGPHSHPQVRFDFPTPSELPPPLIQLIDVDFKYPGREDFGLKGLNIGVDMGSRVAIVGPNGAGKTTLMNLLSGECVRGMHVFMVCVYGVCMVCVCVCEYGVCVYGVCNVYIYV